MKDLVQWGCIGFVANKRTKTAKSDNNGTARMMIGYALDHPSGTCKFYNPTTDSVINSNSVKWSDFKPWEARDLDQAISDLKDLPERNLIPSTKAPTNEIEIDQEN